MSTEANSQEVLRWSIKRSLAVVALALVRLGGCAGSPKQESTGEYIDDSALTAKVKTALLQDPQVSGIAITVDTFKGTVQLSGFANNPQERRRAEAVAGVEAVRNDIGLNYKVINFKCLYNWSGIDSSRRATVFPSE